MIRSTLINMNKSKICTFLIVIAMIFSPFTKIRVGYIGVTEISSLFFIILCLFSRKMKFKLKLTNYFIFTKFWLIFMLLNFVGLFYNYVILGHLSGTVSGMYFDTMAYILVGFVCFSLELFIYNYNRIEIWNILKKIYIYSSSILLLLFIIKQFTPSILGYSLVYGNYFRPIAINIHHTAIAITPLPFLGFKLLFSSNKIYKKVLILLLIISNFVIIESTGSVKAVLALIFGSIVFVYFLISNSISYKKKRILLFLSIIIIVTVFLLIYSTQIVKYIIYFFQKSDIAGAREALYTYSFNKFLKSPFLGYGPGPHSAIEGMEIVYDAHQSFITVALQGGFLALIAFIALYIKIFKICIIDPYILGSYTSIVIYSIGGDILRKLSLWILLVLFYYYCKQKLEF